MLLFYLITQRNILHCIMLGKQLNTLNPINSLIPKHYCVYGSINHNFRDSTLYFEIYKVIPVLKNI